MSFFKTRYVVTGYYGEIYRMTAKQLYKQVIEDSKSDYNWIAPARELVKVCKKPGFPEEYAVAIKIAILDCFVSVEGRANCGGDRYRINPEDQEAVQYCYNSLYGIEAEEAVLARERYLTEMIRTASYIQVVDPLYHPGPTFTKLCKDWRKAKFEEYISKENINFEQEVKTLRSNFSENIKEAEANGNFEEDDKKDRENWQMFFKSLSEQHRPLGKEETSMDCVIVLLLGVITVLFAVVAVWLMYVIVMAIYRKTLRYETFYANVPVCEKEYEKEHITYVMTGKVMVPQFHDRKYNVYLMYEGKSHSIDSEELYGRVNVGEIVRVKVHKGYNKRDEVKDVYLSV